ncbi:MAG: PrsW family intramembrane metalloprotease [Thermoplasmata archaeon]
MTDLTSLEDLLLLLIAALIPAIVYLAWVRQGGRYSTEGWGTLLASFAFGAMFATFVAAIIEVILVAVGTAVSGAYPGPETVFLNGNSTLGTFFLVLVIAPFVEEALKAAGVVRQSAGIVRIADGPVLGAAVGLGFGFFETFLYGIGALATGGLIGGLGLIVVRSLSSVLLHGSTTSEFGYGYAESKLGGKPHYAGAYYLLAVGMHSLFNGLASLGIILGYLGYGTNYVNDATLIGLVVVMVYAFAALEHVRAVVARSDFPGAAAAHPRFRPPPVRAATTNSNAPVHADRQRYANPVRYLPPPRQR